VFHAFVIALALLVPARALAADGDGDWTQQSPTSKPSGRFWRAMANIDRNKGLLFGGMDLFGYRYDTWVYDPNANTWTKKNPTLKPSARFGHAIATMGGDKVLLFGGGGSTGYRAERVKAFCIFRLHFILNVQ
jgi:hypothetical protein